MASEPMVRTLYTDPTSTGLLRPGFTLHAESMVDQTRQTQPFERIHGSGLHDWGIGEGLALTATLNQPGVSVLPGTAVDAAGRPLSLALTGKAEVGPDADNPAVAPQLTDVLATGAVLPTTGLNGSFFVGVRWRETFDADLWNSSNQTVFQVLHTPWLKLELAANINDATDDGSRILLGRVTLNAGNVVALTHERRREAGVPAGRVQFWRAETTGGAPHFKADNTLTAELRSRAAGGLEVTVAGGADQVEFKRDGGNIAQVTFNADRVVGRNGGGAETVVIDPVHGNITLGTQGVEGDVVVKDGHNRLVFVVNGSDASTTIGSAGNEGDLRLLDGAGQTSVRMDGATGTTFLKRLAPVSGGALDVDAFAVRLHAADLVLDGRSGQNQRALVDFNQRLIVNFAGDYAQGVDIVGLHLSDHIRTDVVEGADVSKRPIYNQYITLTEFEPNPPLLDSEWFVTSTCEVGMLDDGTVDNFWWGVANATFVNANGHVVFKWLVNYRDGGDDWRPWRWHVTWIAFRR